MAGEANAEPGNPVEPDPVARARSLSKQRLYEEAAHVLQATARHTWTEATRTVWRLALERSGRGVEAAAAATEAMEAMEQIDTYRADTYRALGAYEGSTPPGTRVARGSLTEWTMREAAGMRRGARRPLLLRKRASSPAGSSRLLGTICERPLGLLTRARIRHEASARWRPCRRHNFNERTAALVDRRSRRIEDAVVYFPTHRELPGSER